MKLYTYWRSTSSYRVRIALALKGVNFESAFVHLVRNGGEQNAPSYIALNPQGRVPTLELNDRVTLIQSAAILEYLEEVYPTPPLLPVDPVARAKVRAVASIIGSDVHPLHNIGPLTHLRNRFRLSEQEVSDWIAKWVGQGLSAVESLIGDRGFCFGPEPSMADVYLLPQLYAARRFSVPLHACPRLLRVEKKANGHPAFQSAHPSAQPDKE